MAGLGFQFTDMMMVFSVRLVLVLFALASTSVSLAGSPESSPSFLAAFSASAAASASSWSLSSASESECVSSSSGVDASCALLRRLKTPRQRPVDTSHTRTVPSSEPEARNWPVGSGEIERMSVFLA